MLEDYVSADEDVLVTDDVTDEAIVDGNSSDEDGDSFLSPVLCNMGMLVLKTWNAFVISKELSADHLAQLDFRE